MVVKKPTAADFEAWTEADDDAVIEEIVADMQVRHVLRGGRYYAKLPDGTVIDLPAKLSLKQAQIAMAMDDDPITALVSLLTGIGEDQSRVLVDEQDLGVVAVLAEDYFNVVSKISQGAVGKLAG